MRASQINGCNACIAAGIEAAKTLGVGSDQCSRCRRGANRRCSTVPNGQPGARRGDDAVGGPPGVVTDEIWAEAAEHYDEAGLSALVSMIALTNFFNRVNTTLRVQPGSWG